MLIVLAHLASHPHIMLDALRHAAHSWIMLDSHRIMLDSHKIMLDSRPGIMLD